MSKLYQYNSVYCEIFIIWCVSLYMKYITVLVLLYITLYRYIISTYIIIVILNYTQLLIYLGIIYLYTQGHYGEKTLTLSFMQNHIFIFLNDPVKIKLV